MFRLIILTAISVAVYGQKQSCNSTYNSTNFTAVSCNQYSKNVTCGAQCSNVADSILDHVSYIVINLSDIVNNEEVFQFNRSNKSFNNRLSEIINKTFTPICQRYTDVMAHKYYLQDILFNGTKLNTTVITKLTLIIINLEVLAKYYHTAQVCVYLYYLYMY